MIAGVVASLAPACPPIATRRAFELGITFELVRIWSGTRKLERQIKARGPSNY